MRKTYPAKGISSPSAGILPAMEHNKPPMVVYSSPWISSWSSSTVVNAVEEEADVAVDDEEEEEDNERKER